MGVSKLLQAMIFLVIGMALLPVVVEFADGIDPISTGVDALVALVPFLYVILLVAGSIAYMKFSGRD